MTFWERDVLDKAIRWCDSNDATDPMSECALARAVNRLKAAREAETGLQPGQWVYSIRDGLYGLWLGAVPGFDRTDRRMVALASMSGGWTLMPKTFVGELRPIDKTELPNHMLPVKGLQFPIIVPHCTLDELPDGTYGASLAELDRMFDWVYAMLVPLADGRGNTDAEKAWMAEHEQSRSER